LAVSLSLAAGVLVAPVASVRVQAAGATYYVSPTGSDAGACTFVAPCRQIRRALTLVNAGDTIFVANGSYLGFDVDSLHGAPGAPITVKAQGTGALVTATTDRPDNRDTIFITFSSYIVIDGLRASNANRAAVRVDQSPNVTIRNGVYANNGTWGIFTDFADDLLLENNECSGSVAEHGIYVSNSGDRPVLRRNRVYGNNASGIQLNADLSAGGDGIITGALIEQNVIFNNGTAGGAAINLDGVQDSIVRNNVLYNNRSTGIVNYQGDGGEGPQGMEILHNTIDMPSTGRWALLISNTTGPNLVRNNILYNRHSFRGGITYGSPADVANTDSDYNVLDRVSQDDGDTVLSLAQWQAQGFELHSFIASDVDLWMSVASADYHLKAGSPAIDQGVFAPNATRDMEGHVRPWGPGVDVGADELVTANFVTTPYVTGLSNPTAMQFAPDGRLFICQQTGELRVFKNGTLLPTPFVSLSVDPSGERGLLGVAFDPDFATNHFLYVYYTTASSPVHNRVSRFTANGDVAAAGSEVAILDLNNLSATNHNGGALHFGPDRKLYVAVGENADGNNSQTLGNLLGKILRINADGSIPSDNPFPSATGINRAIWAMGLRNPFTFAFQPGTGRMFINDVGQNTWEEINDGFAGSNYGWPNTEGPTGVAGFRGPVYAYQHASGSPTGCAITGGAFYNPATVQFPADYIGDYFFADYCGNFVWRYDPVSNTASQFATGISAPVDLKVTDDGSLFYLARGLNAVYRVQNTASQAPVITDQPDSLTVSVGSPASFSVTASGAATLTYQWQRNGANISGATSSTYTLGAAQLADDGARFRCRVSNSLGTATSSEAVLDVTPGTIPTASITQPLAGTLYTAGDTIAYAGTGTDAEDGTLPPSAFTWRVDFHHDTHTHPFVPATTGSTSGSFVIPTLGETAANVWYRIHLTVTDSGGLTHSVFRDVTPRTANVTLQTSPSGLQLLLDGQPRTAPTTFTGVAGIVRSLEAVSPQTLGGTVYEFVSWSDGGARAHTVSTPAANTTYTATYRAVPSLSISDATVTEGNAGTTSASFTVTLAPTSTGTVTVNWATANGTATQPSDYVAGSGVLTFTAGQTSKTITVAVNGDTTSEPDETFFVNLSGASGGSVVDGQGQGTIRNDDALGCPAGLVPPGMAFNVTVNAGSTSLDWVAVFAPGAPHNTWIGDYKYVPLPRPQIVTMVAPMMVGSYEVRLLANNGPNFVGSCPIQVSTGPALFINDVTVTEGNSGTVSASFTVTLSPTSTAPVTVNWATANGTAVAPSDYAAGSGSLTFAPGESTKTVTVLVNGDTTAEPTETFFVNLSGASATVGDGQGQGTITTDEAPPPVVCPASTVMPGAAFNVSVNAGSSSLDWMAVFAPGASNNAWIGNYKYVPLPRPQIVSLVAPMTLGNYEVRLLANNGPNLVGSCALQVSNGPALFVNDVTVTEGNTGTVTASFTVTLSPTSTSPVTVNWATANGTATAPSDYTAGSGSLSFVAGESTKTVTVLVNGDTSPEATETFLVNLSGASGATLGDGQGQGTITTDETPPPVVCPTGTVMPGAAFNVTVFAGNSSMDWLAVFVPGAPNSAWIGNYMYVPLPRPQIVSLVAPMMVGNYEVRLLANNGPNFVGSCPLQISNGPAFFINDVTVTEGNTATVSASFTVTLSPTSTAPATVNWATSNGTASAPSDYAAGSGSLTFAAGESTKTVTVLVNGDTSPEATETFFVNLSGPSGAMLGDSQGQGTITTDETPPPVVCPTGTVMPGAGFNVTVFAGSSSLDWLAVFTPGAPHNSWIGNYRYVPLPRPQIVGLVAPMTVGNYEVRLLANNGPNFVASCPVQVATGP
jgi:parallel beta-helix repeat protein